MESMYLKTKICGMFLLASILLSGCSRQPDGSLRVRYSYDHDGRLTSLSEPDGSKTSFQYNEQGLPITVRYRGGQVSYGYDQSGNRLWMQDETGTTEYYYDAFDRLIGVMSKHSPWRTIVYTYDPWDNVTSTTIVDMERLNDEDEYKDVIRELARQLPDNIQKWQKRIAAYKQFVQLLDSKKSTIAQPWIQYHVAYRYDVTGNLIHMDTPLGSIAYTYAPDGSQVERHLPNGITSQYHYAPDGALQSLYHRDRTGQTLAEYHYNYNAAGLVEQVYERTAEGAKTFRYKYDAQGYLTTLYLPDGSQTRYEYDAVGNRLRKEDAAGTMQYTYDQYGRLRQADNTRYEWTPSGDLAAQHENGLETRLTYDGRHLPMQVTTPEGTVRYKWDGDGVMIFRGASEARHYLPNPLSPNGATLAEFDDAGAMTAGYLYTNVLTGLQVGNGQAEFYLEDGFNAIRHITDGHGHVTACQDYLPFGEPVKVHGTTQSSFRAAGMRYLPELQSYASGNRLYSPALDRDLTAISRPPDRTTHVNPNLHSRPAYSSFAASQTGGVSRREVIRPVTDPNPIGYRLQDINDRLFRKARALIARGQRLPLPSPEQIARYDQYWTSEQYKDSPYYQSIGVGNPQPGFQVALVEPAVQYWLDMYEHSFAEATPENFIGQGLKASFAQAMGGLASTQLEMEQNVNVVLDPTKPLRSRIQAGTKVTMEVGMYFLPVPAKALKISFAKSQPFISFPEIKSIHGGKIIWPGSRTFSTPSKSFKIPLNTLSDVNDLFGAASSMIYPNWNDLHASPDPIRATESQLGGVELAASGEFIGDISRITGLVFDPEQQQLVLVGEHDPALPSLRASDLALALYAVFGMDEHDFEFTLDPADPARPDGDWLRAIYLPVQYVAGTSFGNVMFEADWLLKQYAFGVRVTEDGQVVARTSSVPGFKSAADLAFEEERGGGQARWARYWIVVDEMKIMRNGSTLYFDVARMQVKAKKQVPDPTSPSGLRDIETEEDPVATRFAALFTGQYDEIAREEPTFERLRELAKAVALAKWLKKEGIPVDLSWVEPYVNKRVPYVDSVATLSVKKAKTYTQPFNDGDRKGVKTVTEELHVTGGVDLTVGLPQEIRDDGRAVKLQEAVQAHLRLGGAPIFNVEPDGRVLQASILPLTSAGRAAWQRYSDGQPVNLQRDDQGRLALLSHDGTDYRFNAQGKVASSTDATDHTTDYTYDAHGRLQTVRTVGGGWTVVGQRQGDGGSAWTMANTRGDTLHYVYGEAGLLEQVLVDGQPWATLSYDEAQRTIVVRYGNCYTEQIAFDADGNIKTYEALDSCKATVSKSQMLVFDHTGGRLSKVSGPGMMPIEVTYVGDGFAPALIKAPQAEMHFRYDPEGYLQGVTQSNGMSVTYLYDNSGQVNALQLEHKGRRARYTFSEEGLVQSEGLLGSTIRYGYDDGLLSAVQVEGYGETRYVYDDQKRLREVRLPDGNWTEYRYTLEPPASGDALLSRLREIAIILHPRP